MNWGESGGWRLVWVAVRGKWFAWNYQSDRPGCDVSRQCRWRSTAESVVNSRLEGVALGKDEKRNDSAAQVMDEPKDTSQVRDEDEGEEADVEGEREAGEA